MNHSTDVITSMLAPLRDEAWPGGASGHAGVESRVLAAHWAQRASRWRAMIAFVSRHRLAAAALGLSLLAGGAIAGTYLFNRLYSITISDDQGNVLSAPRILVAPGQSASISIGDPNDPAGVLKVDIDGEGNVTSNRDDVQVDVDVTDVPERKPS